jgi:hypothetical protein
VRVEALATGFYELEEGEESEMVDARFEYMAELTQINEDVTIRMPDLTVPPSSSIRN